MATLIELCEAGALERLDPQLPNKWQELRLVYLMPRALRWLADILPELEGIWDDEISPAEQFQAHVELWARGEPLVYSWQFKPLVHLADGIWEWKTRDLRAFGWFPQKDVFVCAAIDDATKIKEHDLYRGYCSQSAADRDHLSLDEPKFIPGEKPEDVVSNFSYP